MFGNVEASVSGSPSAPSFQPPALTSCRSSCLSLTHLSFPFVSFYHKKYLYYHAKYGMIFFLGKQSTKFCRDLFQFNSIISAFTCVFMSSAYLITFNVLPECFSCTIRLR